MIISDNKGESPLARDTVALVTIKFLELTEYEFLLYPVHFSIQIMQRKYK